MQRNATNSPFGPLTSSPARIRRFRTRLLVAMMLVVSAVIALALYLAERNLAANIDEELERDFASELAELHYAQAIRHSALVERCHSLVRKPRIHAALEDNALDLLYVAADDELRDMLNPAEPVPESADNHAPAMRARFYRFLDRAGHVITPPNAAMAGVVPPAIEAQLALPSLRSAQQVGYVPSDLSPQAVPVEVIATPIISTETGETIAALVLGFRPLDLTGEREMQSGLWLGGTLHFPSLSANARESLAREVRALISHNVSGHRRLDVDGDTHLVFVQRLNAGSEYPSAYEVSLYSLKPFAAAEGQLRFRIFIVGLLLLAGAFVASRVLSRRLSAPVEKLAVDSERSARFSADASHQLKTPVTVLRAGLEELLTHENLTPEECDALAALIHQTYRLSSLIEDLLLLSRMDSGRLKLALGPVDLGQLIAGAVDDLTAMPDAIPLSIETDVPAELHVAGERRYTTIILQNLLENARKYNRPEGRIRIVARPEGEDIYLTIGNTGRPIPAAAQSHIFERFHRGEMGENVPGYGLGLNLARELARLHEGELRLVRSDDEWTEFEVKFRTARPALVAV
jgi:signal transduction histidine kinase